MDQDSDNNSEAAEALNELEELQREEDRNPFARLDSGPTTFRQIVSALLNTGSSNAELPADLISILRTYGISIEIQPDHGHGLYDDDNEEDEEDDEDGDVRVDRSAFPHHSGPQAAGLELLDSGEFGRVGSRWKGRGPLNLDKRATRDDSDSLRESSSPVEERGCSMGRDMDKRMRHVQRNVTKRILGETSLRYTTLYKQDYIEALVPNTNGTAVASYPANVYTAQFSDDSSFYYTCAQDYRLHVYDMTAPPSHSRIRSNIPGSSRYAFQDSWDGDMKTTMKISKQIQGVHGRWTITDANLSPDNSKMIYSSITSTVYMTSVLDASTEQIPIRFAEPYNRRGYAYEDRFGIWSCRFSADGNEIIAGGSGEILVYDLLADRKTVAIHAHDDDVNSCCWADTASGNVLISASDDTFLKVWDRRSLGASNRPSGVLVGHTEGITYVSAKGDGRYVISNGKDQALRLWDLRYMRSDEEFESLKSVHYGIPNFDYRYPTYPRTRRLSHPKDCSVMTYRGHAVLRTLIRCHFSPMETTGAGYVYSGSADGRIHIWSLDGQIVQVLDRSKTLPMSFDPTEREPDTSAAGRRSVCVRDVSWSSQEPLLMSAGWEGGNRTGSIVAAHYWKGLNRLMPSGALEDWNEKQRLEASMGRPVRSSRNVSGRGNIADFLVGGDDEDEEDDSSYVYDEQDDSEWEDENEDEE
jgi:WD repeat-containing protein 23